jgi:hypothetical protein
MLIVAWRPGPLVRAAAFAALSCSAVFNGDGPPPPPPPIGDSTAHLVIRWTPSRAPRAAINAALRLKAGPELGVAPPFTGTAVLALDAAADLTTDEAPYGDAGGITVVGWRSTPKIGTLRAATQALYREEAKNPDSTAVVAVSETYTSRPPIRWRPPRSWLRAATRGYNDTESLPPVIPGALDGSAILALSASGTLSTAIPLQATATLALDAAASLVPADLPLTAIERPLAVEFLVQVGDSIRVGTRAHVGASWLSNPASWISNPDSWLELRPAYRPSLLDPGVVEARLQRESYGFTDVSRWRFRIDNSDGRYNALWGSQGLPVIRWRHDRRVTPPLTLLEFQGVLDRVTIGDGDDPTVMVCEATTQNLSALDTLIPSRLTSTELFFGETCPEPGTPVKKVIGNVQKVRLPYIIDDTVDSEFWYGPLEGQVAVTALYRDRGSGINPELMDPSEYTVAYSGPTFDWTAVRTYVRQVQFGGGFHVLYADVSGPENERNPAVAFGSIMSNTRWGCGQPVDWAAIYAEAALLPAALKIDGVIGWDETQRTAREYIDLICMLRGGRPVLDAERGWSVEFDSVAPTEAMMVLRDDAGPGEKTLLSIGQRTGPALNDRIKTLRVRYGWDDSTQTYLYTTSDRDVSSLGRVEIIDHPLLANGTSADHGAYYMAIRKGDEADLVTDAIVHEGGRRLRPGHIVHAICPQLQIASEDRLVIGVALDAGRQVVHHIRQTPAKYTHVAGTVPPLRVVSAPGGTLVSPFGNISTAPDAPENTVRIVSEFEFADQNLTNTPLNYVTVTLTSYGGAIVVISTFRIFENASGRGTTTFYTIKNITTGSGSSFNAVFQTATGPILTTTLQARMVEVLPAGTYTYALQVFDSGASAPFWIIEAAEIIALEFRR